MYVIVRRIVDSEREIAQTKRLAAVIAEDLWARFGGEGGLNWTEAGRHLQRIVSGACREARETVVLEVDLRGLVAGLPAPSPRPPRTRWARGGAISARHQAHSRPMSPITPGH